MLYVHYKYFKQLCNNKYNSIDKLYYCSDTQLLRNLITL